MRITTKRSLLVSAIVCCVTNVLAQNPKGQCSVRPMAGMNIASFSGGVADLYYPKVRLTDGIEMEYAVRKYTGYHSAGEYELIVSVDGNVYSDYINFPLLANIYIPQLEGLALKVGVQWGALKLSYLGVFLWLFTKD